jgi:hypothetical protein
LENTVVIRKRINQKGDRKKKWENNNKFPKGKKTGGNTEGSHEKNNKIK